jgi:hypothetical protein
MYQTRELSPNGSKSVPKIESAANPKKRPNPYTTQLAAIFSLGRGFAAESFDTLQSPSCLQRTSIVDTDPRRAVPWLL